MSSASSILYRAHFWLASRRLVEIISIVRAISLLLITDVLIARLLKAIVALENVPRPNLE